MGGFTFCCGDFAEMMDAKGTVTNEILQMIEEDPRVCYINSDSTVNRVAAAMKKHPDRVLDPGIQEMNMVTIAAGLAKEGMIPFVSIYSSFYQRAYDQVIHDICLQNLPVIMCVDRAGIGGKDGETHPPCRRCRSGNRPDRAGSMLFPSPAEREQIGRSGAVFKLPQGQNPSFAGYQI